jgi:His/Glu/Gln/Arg/opine family amino acid ABC transporter permease subunit
MDNFNVDLIYRSLPLLSKGALMTVQMLLAAGALSIPIGSLLGILTCRKLSGRILTPLITSATFVLRAVPFYVQLLIVYFVLPEVLNINIEAFTAAILALGACSAGYVSQVVRCGINSIPQEQWEAALTLGYSTVNSLRYIILPQMLRNVLPALTNELDALLKSTAILSSIGLLELTRMGMNIVSREMEPLVIYLTVAAFYVAISGIINLLSKYFENRFRYVNG